MHSEYTNAYESEAYDPILQLSYSFSTHSDITLGG